MKDKNIDSHLFQRYIQGKCTSGEIRILLQYFNTSGNEDRLKHLIRQQLEANTDNDYSSQNELQPLIDSAYNNIKTAITSNEQSGQITYIPIIKRRWMQVAASVIFLFSAVTWFYFSSKQKTLPKSTPNHPQFTEQIMPGGEKAILTLADGTAILLDSAGNGQLAQQGKTSIVKLSNGELLYQPGNENSDEVLYNTISTPRGGQYKLVLPDGSKVWLNAASSLRYPTTFTGEERKVEIKGEAYFEVASVYNKQNKRIPFKVNVVTSSGINGGEIEVLGTQFNVNAYEDQSDVKTTLLEGSVKISKGTSHHILKPGQQALVKLSGNINVLNEVDTEEVMGWKNGTFIFNRNDLHTIMNQISRWYDADIEYKGIASKETFSAIISRSSSIMQVLKIMEAGGVRFKIEGKKIIVMQ